MIGSQSKKTGSLPSSEGFSSKDTLLESSMKSSTNPVPLQNFSNIEHLQNTIGNQQTINVLSNNLNYATNKHGLVVNDPNQNRASRTRGLITKIGRGLNINTNSLIINSDKQALIETTGKSPGFANGNTLMLNPSVYDATSKHSQEMLAHEVAHFAQSQNSQVRGVNQSQTSWLAEIEAGLVARDFVAGRKIDPVVFSIPSGKMAGFSLPDLASMEQLKSIKMSIANSIRSRVGNRPAAKFVVNKMFHWADDDFQGMLNEDADLDFGESEWDVLPQEIAIENTEEPELSNQDIRQQLRRNDPEYFKNLRAEERTTIREQRGLERNIRREIRTDRRERRKKKGRARVNAFDVVLGLMRALTGTAAELVHATPLLPMRLGLQREKVKFDTVVDARLRGVEISGALDIDFLGNRIRIGDAAPPPLGSRDKPALRRSRHVSIHFPWFSFNVFGTLPETKLPFFESGPGYIRPSHLVIEWMNLALPGISYGIPGIAPGLLSIVDWGGKKPWIRATGINLGPGRGHPFETIQFKDGPVDLSILGGLCSISGLNIPEEGGEVSNDGAMRLSLEARELKMFGGQVKVSNPAIRYDSREGLQILFNGFNFGGITVQSGELGPAAQVKLVNGQISSLNIGFQQLLIRSDGTFKITGERPSSMSQVIYSITNNVLSRFVSSNEKNISDTSGQPVLPERSADIEVTKTPESSLQTTDKSEETMDKSNVKKKKFRFNWPRFNLRRNKNIREENEQVTHIVKRGETLSVIAGLYYNDISRYPEIAEANNIVGPDYSIEVDQELVIPDSTDIRDNDISVPVEQEPKADRGGIFFDRRKMTFPKIGELFSRKRNKDKSGNDRINESEQETESALSVTQENESESRGLHNENVYTIKNSKAYIRDESGNILPDKQVIPKWITVTLLETRKVTPEGNDVEIENAKIRYKQDERSITYWTNMTNLYPQYWNQEKHRAEYEELDLGYAEAMLSIDTEKTRAARIKSGRGVRGVIDQFYPNSTEISSLSSEVQPKFNSLINYLESHGMSVTINAALRHPLRSLVFESAIKAAQSEDGLLKAQAQSIRYSVPIDWLHYDSEGLFDLNRSKSKANEVKDVFGLRSKASRGVKDELGGRYSKHNFGNAVDMSISFSFDEKTIEKNGREYVINAVNETPVPVGKEMILKNCAKKDLAQLGKNEFGITRAMDDDAVHWSPTGG